MSQLLIVAVGLPCLIVLARNAPLAALEPDASKRSPPPSRGRRASGRQRPRALPARKVGPPVAQPDRVRLAARLAVGLGVWLLVATVLSPQPAVAFFGVQARANGALLGLALVAAWAIGVSSGRDAAAAIESVLLGVVGLNAIVALVQTISGVGLASGRAQGLFGNPVFLAGLPYLCADGARQRKIVEVTGSDGSAFDLGRPDAVLRTSGTLVAGELAIASAAPLTVRNPPAGPASGSAAGWRRSEGRPAPRHAPGKASPAAGSASGSRSGRGRCMPSNTVRFRGKGPDKSKRPPKGSRPWRSPGTTRSRRSTTRTTSSSSTS